MINQSQSTLKRQSTHGKGWKPDLPDKRDYHYDRSSFYHLEASKPRPPLVDLRATGHVPAIEDQGQLGSCTAFGTLAAFNFAHHLKHGSFFEASHLFQYYQTRLLEGSVNEDAGGEIRDAIKVTKQFGTIPETEFPYDIAKFKHKPSAAELKDALNHQSTQYLRVINDANRGGLTHLETCLAAGFPVVFGSTLYASFESEAVAANGIVPMPEPGEEMLGGHCQLIVGYDRIRRLFLVRNSWGTSWALTGYEYMPYEYLTDTDLADDFWTIRNTEE